MSEKQKIGWVGLGKMGIPMAKNLLKKGYSVMVYNRTKEKTKELTAEGAKVAESMKALAAESDVIISMISDDPVLEEVSFGANGVFQGAKSGTIFIDMSTVSPVASGKVAEAAKKKGIKYLRAPVSGSTALATAGTLTIFASGPKDAFDASAEIFGSMGQKVFHVGEGDEARYLKLLLNMMVGITSAMTAEALTFGKRGGMDWTQMIDIIGNSVVASPLVNYKAQMLKSRNFTAMFTADQIAKDFDIALDTGKSINVPMPITTMVREYYETMRKKGNGGLDFFGLVTLMEDLAGIKS